MRCVVGVLVCVKVGKKFQVCWGGGGRSVRGQVKGWR